MVTFVQISYNYVEHMNLYKPSYIIMGFGFDAHVFIHTHVLTSSYVMVSKIWLQSLLKGNILNASMLGIMAPKLVCSIEKFITFQCLIV